MLYAMRPAFLAILLACLLMPAASVAEDADQNEVGQEIGAVLAWRLGPEAVEEWCQQADPDGVAIRKEALQGWLKANDGRIAAVDSRVAEIVPLVFPQAPKADVVREVRAQVKALIYESIFEGKTPAEMTAICKADADPARPRWNDTGMPKLQLSLAALYDWQVARGNRKAD